LRFTMTENGSVAAFNTLFTMRAKADAADPVVFQKTGTILDAGSSTTKGVFGVAITKAESVLWEQRVHAFSFVRTDNDDLYTIGKVDVRYDVRNAA